jgi:hypothetical protein
MFVAVLLLLLTRNAAASTIIDTGVSGSGVGVFGEGPSVVETFGQVFMAPIGDNRLDSFRLRIDDRASAGGDNIEFYAYVMAWSGTSALGPVLYQSAYQSTSLAPDYESFTFDTGGLDLVGGNSYIAFVSSSTAGDGVSGGGFMNLGSVPYSDGNYFLLNNGTNFAGVYTPWTSGGTSDLAFRAEFNTHAVSETGSSLFIFGGSLALLIMAASCMRW